MIRSRASAIFTAGALALCGFALAQHADPNTAAPTKNDYRLRLIEPAEGARITGSTVQVVVDLNPPPEVGGERRDVNSMPRPRVDVFLDNEAKGTLTELHNVLTVDGLSAGSHKLVVLAKNLSGEVIDRKQITFTSEPATTSVAQTIVETHRAPAAEPSGQTVAPPPPEPPRASARLETAPPPPAAPPAPREEMLPQTASHVPLAAAAGLALVAAGLALRRRG